MANSDLGQLPSSLEEVELLVLQLYQPGAPEKVAKTQETLQKLQRSPEGWQIANSLLESKAENVRFFGALTYIVKLNTDSKSLSDDDAQALLQNLIGWLVRCLKNGEGALVVRKLCSTLVAYFLQFSTSWIRCVRHLLYCLSRNEVIPYTSLAEASDTPLLIESLSNDKAIVIFWFAATLVDEVGKTDSNAMKQYKFHRRVVPNVTDIVPLIDKYISSDASAVQLGNKGRQEAMKCLQACVSYSHRAFIDDEIVLDPLRTLTKPAIMSLVDDGLYEIAIELITDTLSNYSKFLHKEDFTLLYSLFNSPWAQERYQRLIGGDFDFDSMQFGQFMVAFGDATVQDLTQKIDEDTQCRQFLSALVGLLSAEGQIVNEDKIFVPALEFWATFLETMIDDIYSATDGAKPSWFPTATNFLMQVIHNCWRKIQYPPDFSSWDSVERTGFKDARRDFGDLVENLYIITGIPILSVFIDLMQQSISSGNWSELETSFDCLSYFDDAISGHPERNAYLDKVFSPAIFELFSASNASVPTTAMVTFLSLMSRYADFFAEHTDNLPQVLNLAFSSVSSCDPNLSLTASSMIEKLCSDCRTVLIPELGVFLQQYSSMTRAVLSNRTRRAIFKSIAAIIQAIPKEESQIAPLEQLLWFIETDIDQGLRMFPSGSNNGLATESSIVYSPSNHETGWQSAYELCRKAMTCLEGMARGLQAPADQPFDLEKDEDTFWIQGKGSIIQRHIIAMMTRVYDVFGNQSDIVEACCQIFRAGFVERSGAFAFSTEVVAQFILKSDLQTPHLGLIISTSCSLLSSIKSDSSVNQVIHGLVKWITHILQSQGEPGNDPEIAQNSIEFLSRLVPSYLNVLLAHQPPASVEFLFMFTLKALAGNDPLPKIAASDFWSNFLAASTASTPEKDSINSAMQHLGPLLARSLIYNIGGNASRSELDKLSEPLRKLVVSQIQSKAWLEAALRGDDYDGERVDMKARMVFLQRVLNLRGARGTNTVVKEFWLACRGTNFAYTS